MKKLFDYRGDDYGFLGGVPARDLTEHDIDALPDYLARSIAESEAYTTTADGKRYLAKRFPPEPEAPQSPIPDAPTN